MISSVISSSHHFYVVYVETSAASSAIDLLNLLTDNKDFEKKQVSEGKSEYYLHAQIELPFPIGSETLMSQNKGRTELGKQFYWYDLYLGEVNVLGKKYFSICYPYNRLGKILDDFFSIKKIHKKVLKPDVNIVLDYMKNRGVSGLSEVELAGLLVDITKYSAEIKEEVHANRINIIGNNPLNSRVFQILSQDPEIGVEPLSLRLKCSDESFSNVELAFDRLGNFRFWMKRDAQQSVMSILPQTMLFFSEIKSLKESSYINSFTLLEDEQ